jgi:hypothetical protein
MSVLLRQSIVKPAMGFSTTIHHIAINVPLPSIMLQNYNSAGFVVVNLLVTYTLCILVEIVICAM